jgi:hypothetical protein
MHMPSRQFIGAWQSILNSRRLATLAENSSIWRLLQKGDVLVSRYVHATPELDPDMRPSAMQVIRCATARTMNQYAARVINEWKASFPLKYILAGYMRF